MRPRAHRYFDKHVKQMCLKQARRKFGDGWGLSQPTFAEKLVPLIPQHVNYNSLPLNYDMDFV